MAFGGETDHKGAAGTATCRELDRIAGDFHELMVAHCPLCNGMGPQCIVETMQEALAGAEEPDADAEAEAPVHAAIRQ